MNKYCSIVYVCHYVLVDLDFIIYTLSYSAILLYFVAQIVLSLAIRSSSSQLLGPFSIPSSLQGN